MERLTPIVRISAGLVILTCSILIVVDLLGGFPAPADTALESRLQLCETLSVQAASAAEDSDLGVLRSLLHVAVRRNPELLSAGLRAPGGHLLVATTDHRDLWSPPAGEGSTSTHVRVPLFKAGRPWATLEVRFARLGSGGWLASLWGRPLIRLLAYVGGAGFFVYLVYMRRTLRHLDPSAVIPTRVQAALDVMAEGVVLIDAQERIVLANAGLAERLGRPAASLLGLQLSSLRWKSGQDPIPGEFPWVAVLRESQTSTGTPLRIETEDGDERIWVVNGSPVLDGWGRPKGAIVTFDDVTELDRRTAELKAAMEALEESQEEIRHQNEELRHLAKSDPLTGVANRRAFMERFESRFEAARQQGVELCCVMGDIDHFKAVNDAHGHSAGDEVIRRVAELLASALRSTDAVCRYGGEEFCIILDGVPIEAAARVSERLRGKIDSPGFARVSVTMSFGVSSTRFGAAKLAQLIDQADTALYAAKQVGRNRVARWDEIGNVDSLGADAQPGKP